MRNSVSTRGFTLVELMVALVVTGIILSAISTLAFALSSANKSTGDVNIRQAQVRITTLRIQELIRNCNLICSQSDDDIAIWLADNNNDKKINISELAYIDFGSDRNHLYLYTFSSNNNSIIDIDSIKAYSTDWWSSYSSNTEPVKLLPECSNVEFQFDTMPPGSKFVNIEFEMTENNVVRQYQINAALRSWNGNIIDESGNIISDDD
ncbi:MAG: type II secretion system protein [Sedimentisphaerales bacterium]|nr:type II secretion system protein [Sedimentisphaerales bacterium]